MTDRHLTQSYVAARITSLFQNFADLLHPYGWHPQLGFTGCKLVTGCLLPHGVASHLEHLGCRQQRGQVFLTAAFFFVALVSANKGHSFARADQGCLHSCIVRFGGTESEPSVVCCHSSQVVIYDGPVFATSGKLPPGVMYEVPGSAFC